VAESSVTEAFAQEISELPVGQALQVFHRADGTWKIVRLVFGPTLLSTIQNYAREGATLEAAVISQEEKQRS